MTLGKYRQHSLLTAVDQITSKPQRMFLQREPLLPYWASMKGLAKIHLTLLPNCKEPDCITLLAALSIPEEVFLSRVQEQSSPRAARSGVQLGEPCAVSHGWGGDQEKTHPGQLEPHLLQVPMQLLQHMSVLVWLWVSSHPCLSAHDCPHGLREHLSQMLPTILSSWLHNIRVQDPGHLHPPSTLPESTGTDGCIPISHSSVERKSLLHTGKALLSPWTA